MKKESRKEDLLNIDPTKKPTFQQVLFVAGGLYALSEDKKHRTRDRELARVSSVWLVNLGIQLYEESKVQNGNA